MAGRIFDQVVAVVAVVLLSPLLLAIGLLVMLTSRGPAFYNQVRVGLNGRAFRIHKFRTMVVGADRRAANVSAAGDPRVTRVGRVLRATYLDELPQLVNVIKGDMSLVGPRPETPEYVARYSPEERRVLSIRPGIVGPSTLGFMDEAAVLAEAADPVVHYETVMLHERVRLDLAYLKDQSFSYDVRLLCRQLVAIVRRVTPPTSQ
jgi:lipopolysaccharide/colanic/teichoic acid biosynthesis glycosyltransferase